MKYFLINRDNYCEKKWKNKTAMLIALKKKDILDDCCHTWNDKKVVYHEWYVQPSIYDYKYMIKDEYNRIVNIGDLKGVLQRFKEPPEVERGYYPWCSWDDNWWEGSTFWTLHHKRSGKRGNWFAYNYRHKQRVQQERRISCDPMHKPYVRGKRTSSALDPWGLIEGGCHITITWKQLKIKKQWQEKLLTK